MDINKMISIFLIFILISTAAFSISSLSTAENENISDDSNWSMHRGNPRHTGRSHYDMSHVNGSENWVFKKENQLFNSPIVGPDDTVYVGTDENYLYRVYQNGTEKWHFFPYKFSYKPESKKPIYSPAIGKDGTIHVASGRGKLYALDSDKSLKWSFETDGEIHAPPVIDDNGTVYVISRISTILDDTEKWCYQMKDVSKKKDRSRGFKTKKTNFTN